MFYGLYLHTIYALQIYDECAQKIKIIVHKMVLTSKEAK